MRWYVKLARDTDQGPYSTFLSPDPPRSDGAAQMAPPGLPEDFKRIEPDVPVHQRPVRKKKNRKGKGRNRSLVRQRSKGRGMVRDFKS